MLLNDAGQAMLGLGICATVAVIVVSIARVHMSNAEARKQAVRSPVAPDVQDRISRIEHAVDAIAIEVERMSEGQRFTTRLLAEKLGEPARGPGGQPASSQIRISGEHGTNGSGGSHGR